MLFLFLSSPSLTPNTNTVYLRCTRIALNFCLTIFVYVFFENFIRFLFFFGKCRLSATSHKILIDHGLFSRNVCLLRLRVHFSLPKTHVVRASSLLNILINKRHLAFLSRFFRTTRTDPSQREPPCSRPECFHYLLMLLFLYFPLSFLKPF